MEVVALHSRSSGGRGTLPIAEQPPVGIANTTLTHPDSNIITNLMQRWYVNTFMSKTTPCRNMTSTQHVLTCLHKRGNIA